MAMGTSRSSPIATCVVGVQVVGDGCVMVWVRNFELFAQQFLRMATRVQVGRHRREGRCRVQSSDAERATHNRQTYFTNYILFL